MWPSSKEQEVTDEHDVDEFPAEVEHGVPELEEPPNDDAQDDEPGDDAAPND